VADATAGPEEITIGPARPTEAEALSALALRSKAHWGYPPDWLREWASLLTLSPADLEAREVFVARRGLEPVGFYSLEFARSASLEHLWVDPRLLRRGVGRLLLEHAAGRTAERGYDRLMIDSDPHAEAFYRRLGAVRVGWIDASVRGTPRRIPRLALDVRGSAI